MKIKKNIVLVLLLVIIISPDTIAQIVLNENDLPKIGDIQTSIKVDSVQALSVISGNKGENVYWDFSNISGKDYSYFTWTDAAKAAGYSQFPGADLAVNKACVKTHSHATHSDIEICKNDFYFKKNSGLYFYGSDVTSISKYEIAENIFPILNYGDSINNESRIIYYSDGTIQKIRHIKGYSKADAWGTIKTPAGITDIIRIYTSETVFDSTLTNGITTSRKVSEGNYYYKWYSKGLGYPVMQISKGYFAGGGNYQIAEYAASLKPVSTEIIKVQSDQKNTTIFPNPFTTSAVIKLGSDAPINDLTLSITDFYGRIVLRKVYFGNEIVVERKNLQPGIYFFTVTAKNYSNKGKFIIANNQ